MTEVQFYGLTDPCDQRIAQVGHSQVVQRSGSRNQLALAVIPGDMRMTDSGDLYSSVGFA
jgi:hypothetical protein